jgi:hypothetical protein
MKALFLHRNPLVMLLVTMLAAFTVNPLAMARPAHDSAASKAVAAYGNLPLSFEANRGQTDEQVRFLSRGQGYGLFMTSTEAVLALSKNEAGQNSAAKESVLRMQLLGANLAAQVTGRNALLTQSNYFIGNDPKAWRSNVPHYGKVHYQGVYPGIDLVFYGTEAGQLEYDFVVAPGADPNNIALGIEGADKLVLDASGDLVLHVAGGEVRLRKPYVYQEVDGAKQAIAGHYTLKDERVGFQLAAYDAGRPLVIDPVLVYATYLGGSYFDDGQGIAMDSEGNAYVTGYTRSSDFPATVGAYQVSPSTAGSGYDVYVAKLGPGGSELLYATYLGGAQSEAAYGIAVDGSGNAYVTGNTSSSNFPTTVGAYDESFNAGIDVFVTKLSADGATLDYSTFLGGNGQDVGFAVAVDSSANAYVTGYTGSSDFPAVNAYAAALTGTYDAFVTKLNASGSAVDYSTYLGGAETSGFENGNGIAVSGSPATIYVTGAVRSAGLATPAVAQVTYEGNGDAFMAKFDPSQTEGDTLAYLTYVGGSSGEEGNGITVDGSGNAFVTGYTSSTDFPTTGSAYQPNKQAGNDVFVTKVIPAVSANFAYSTYLGGNGADYGTGIAVDGDGNAIVTGYVYSTTFPTTVDAQQNSNAGSPDAFVTKLNGGGSGLLYSTYFGGESNDNGTAIAVDGAGNAYIAGYTQSKRTFPITRGALKNRLDKNDPTDAFVAKIVITPPSDVGVAGGGFNTRGRVVLSRCGAPPCSENVKIKVKNYGETSTAVAFSLASNAPGVAAPQAGCTGTTSILSPRGTQAVTGCTVEYSEPGIFALTLTVSPTLGTDIDLSNNEAVKKVKVVP